jgi:hypothetical protein
VSTFVGSGTVVATNGSLPGAVSVFSNTNAETDLLLWFVYGRADGGDESVAFPAGWNQITGSPFVAAAGGLLAVAWRIRAAGDTTYTLSSVTNFTSATGGETILTWIETWTDFNRTTPVSSVVSSMSTWASSTTLGPVASTGMSTVPNGGAVVVFAGRKENVSTQTTLTGDGLRWGPGTRGDSTLGADAGAVTQWGENETGSAVTMTSKSITTTGTAQVGGGIMFVINKPADGVVGGVAAEGASWWGPIIDGNGNLYAITENHEPAPDPAIRKSTDAGVTWVEVDAANRPSGSTWQDLESLWLIKSGTKGQYLRQRSGTTANHISEHIFNLSDAGASPDTWVSNTAIIGAITTSTSFQSCCYVERSNGDLLAFYCYDNAVGSNLQGAFYRKRTSGGAWGSEVVLRESTTRAWTQVNAVVGESDKIHIFLHDDTSGSTTCEHASLDSGDSLSSWEALTGSTSQSSEAQMAPAAVYWDDAGTERIFCAYIASTGDIRGNWVVNDGTPGAQETVSDVAVWLNPPQLGNFGPSACVAVNPANGEVFCVYGDNATHDLQLARRNPSTGLWGTDTELVNNCEAQINSCAVFTHSVGNGGNTVLGIIYDDLPASGDSTTLGVLKYTEVVLSTPAAGATLIWQPAMSSLYRR